MRFSIVIIFLLGFQVLCAQELIFEFEGLNIIIEKKAGTDSSTIIFKISNNSEEEIYYLNKSICSVNCNKTDTTNIIFLGDFYTQLETKLSLEKISRHQCLIKEYTICSRFNNVKLFFAYVESKNKLKKDLTKAQLNKIEPSDYGIIMPSILYYNKRIDIDIGRLSEKK